MTEAYAIKDSTGKIIDVGMDEADLKRQWHSSYTCVPVTVSENGEAEALLREAGALLNRYRKETPLGNQPHMIAEQAVDSIQRIDAYLSRGRVCEHGQGLTDYCQPCGRVNGGG